jgi:hypothetical protein
VPSAHVELVIVLEQQRPGEAGIRQGC